MVHVRYPYMYMNIILRICLELYVRGYNIVDHCEGVF